MELFGLYQSMVLFYFILFFSWNHSYKLGAPYLNFLFWWLKTWILEVEGVIFKWKILNYVQIRVKKEEEEEEEEEERSLSACVIYTINNKISYLGFNILHTKIPSHNFLNSLKYTYLLVK